MSRRLRDAWAAWQKARPHLLPPAEHRRVLAAARLEQHGQLVALYLSGTPYEMGYQHGVLARELIHRYRKVAYAYVTSLVREATRPSPPAWLVRPLLFRQVAAYWPTIPAPQVQEMQGIADGAGVHPIEALVSTAIWEMFLVSGCSEFAATGPMTASGSLLHGYNYDLMHPDHALIQPYVAVLFFRPSEGIPFVTVNTVGSVGANAGMNQAGITVAWDNTYLRDQNLIENSAPPVVPFIITLRRLLQRAHSLSQAMEIVTRSLPRPWGDIVIIGSQSEARAVALETAGHQHAVREMKDGAVWSTNCFRSPELAPHDRRGQGEGLPEVESWQRFPRYMAYEQLFAAHRGQLTPAAAADFLRDPYPREAEGLLYPTRAPRSSICRDITSWSLVMEPKRGRLWVSDTQLPGCQGPFFAFDLPDWRRVPDQDLAPTGYRAALLCAECLLAGDWEKSQAALVDALAADGPTAPLLLAQSLLHGLAGREDMASEALRRLTDRWGETPAGALARAWLQGKGEANLQIPFPSAIRSLIVLRPAPTWQERAKPVRTGQPGQAFTAVDGAICEEETR